MVTRVEMWGNDLWSISIKKKNKKEEISEKSNSNKLAVLIFFVCLLFIIAYNVNKAQEKT